VVYVKLGSSHGGVSIQNKFVTKVAVSAASAVLLLTVLSNAGISRVEAAQNTMEQSSGSIEKVIQIGYDFMGTPYEFGSNRETTTTFDCSDFVRHIFKVGTGTILPSTSAEQADYVQKHSKIKTDWHDLKRGDLMFFMSSQGASKSDYTGLNKSRQEVTHVAIYLGNGQVLHTYSKDSGGVRTDYIEGKQWDYRFLFGGSV